MACANHSHMHITRTLVSELICPSIGRLVCRSHIARNKPILAPSRFERPVHADATSDATPVEPKHLQLVGLPRTCPGCGGYSRWGSSEEAGFYSSNRKSVKTYLARHELDAGDGLKESVIFDQVLGVSDASLRSQLGLHDGVGAKTTETPSHVPTPVCNRCHHVLHHSEGTPLVHPTIQSLQEIISTSPHKHNHIYHILDAADFPLSLVPSIQQRLSLTPQRSQNRRAKTSLYHHGRTMDMSFIITRSDLLAPCKEQVDSLMPCIIQVLRDALGGTAANARLGNVRCVSAKRGWWTGQVKEEIYNRGGGGWMVGKVNVGKSNLFENVFPKGRTGDVGHKALLHNAEGQRQQLPSSPRAISSVTHCDRQQLSGFRENDLGPLPDTLLPDTLLPPTPPETPFPVLPIVSSLPGTTISPIRLSFGNGKGELIDLPGLGRGDLQAHVMENHKRELLMQDRPKPQQISVKHGQSLLLGGLIRITPLTPNLNILAYPFLSLKPHVASTERVTTKHTEHEPSVPGSIAKPGIGHRMVSAGRFSVKYDVTKQRAGPLTSKAAAGLNTHVLPFLVFSIDVLVEGCGWVELAAQVRKKDFEKPAVAGTFLDDKPYPQIEVVSPGGRHIGVRRPMGAWLLYKRKPGSSKATVRPRKSMRGVKKRLKALKRLD